MFSSGLARRVTFALLLAAVFTSALLAGSCGRTDRAPQPETMARDIDLPFDVEVETGRISAEQVIVRVTPRINGSLRAIATNEESGLTTETSPLAAETGMGVSFTLALPLPQPLAGDGSVVKTEIVLTDEAGNHYGAYHRLKVSRVDGDLNVEEIPLAPPMPPGTEATAEPVDDAELPPPLLGPAPQKHPTESQPLSDASPGTVTVTGTWGYTDRNGVSRVLPSARVEIWDSDWSSADDLLGTTWADNYGYYSITVNNSDCIGCDGIDVYVRVLSTDDYSVQVTNSNGHLYYSDTSVYPDRPDGTLDVGTWVVTDVARAPAFYMVDLIGDDALYYLFSQAGWNNNLNLRVNWPDNWCGGSCYVWDHDQIHLILLDRWDSDVILHEYGHFVMDQNWATPPPTPNCNPHWPGMNSSLGCAWVEGWATYLQAAIQNDPIYTDTENVNIRDDIENATAAWHDPQDEGSVMASLWDIHDPANEDWDGASDNINGSSNNGIWRVSAGTDAVDVNDFWSDWRSVNNRILCQVAAILDHHGISPNSCPDLVVDGVSNPPAVGNRGDSFSVTDNTRNQGFGFINPSVNRYYLSTDTTKGAGDTLLTGSRSVPALGPGASSSGSTTVTIPASTADGGYYLLACADDTGVVSESNESNNCRASFFTITIPVPMPDLMVDGVSNPPAFGNRGDSFGVGDTTRNQGSGSAGSSVTRYYLSTDTTRGAGDTLLTGSRSVPALGPGASSTGSVAVTIPASTADGGYYLLACADDTAAVSESNENNNCRASSTTITIPVPAPAPNRFFGDVTLDAAPAPPGTDVIATIAGSVCGQTTVQRDSTYLVDVVSSGVTRGCGTEGATVYFWVAGCPAGTATWHSGQWTELDLSAVCGPDSDGDGCTSNQEDVGAPPPVPGSTCSTRSACYSDSHWYDFYDVPVPANPDSTPSGPRDGAVAIDDVVATLFYFGTVDGDDGYPNSNGVTYDSLKDGDWFNGAGQVISPDGLVNQWDKVGRRYDRSPSAVPNPPWDAGTPDGAVGMDDVLVVLAQFGLDCSTP